MPQKALCSRARGGEPRELLGAKWKIEFFTLGRGSTGKPQNFYGFFFGGPLFFFWGGLCFFFFFFCGAFFSFSIILKSLWA